MEGKRKRITGKSGVGYRRRGMKEIKGRWKENRERNSGRKKGRKGKSSVKRERKKEEKARKKERSTKTERVEWWKESIREARKKGKEMEK